MYFKLAIKNIKRSLKDYKIHFLTLVLAITIFYSFNSLSAQKSMMNLNSGQVLSLSMVNRIMNITSVFVSFVLVFLIVYANNYLIKKRKKEFGIYMTLGMKRGTVAKILFYETLIIGLASLIIGIIIGVFLSQVLTIFTAKLFKVDIIDFKFIFSSSAMIKTIGCFILIYILVFIFNGITIKKLTLINLINAKKKNDNFIKNIWVSIALFIVSCLMIGRAYYIMLDKGISTIGSSDILAISLGAFGTFLLFFSISGFLLKVFQSNKRFYLKGLNSFVLRQISSKMNTTFISMTFVSLMLFFAVCTLSVGFGINKGINDNLKDLTQFDISLLNHKGKDIVNLLKDKNFNINDYSKEYVNVDYYSSNVHYSDILTKAEREEFHDYYPVASNETINVIKSSQLNKILKLLNENPITINNNEFAILSDCDDMINSLNKFLLSNKKININGKELTSSKNKVINEVINIGNIKSNIAIVVVNDDAIAKEQPVLSNLLIKNSDNLNILTKKLEELSKKSINKDNSFYIMTKETVINSSIGMAAGISYLSLYLGFIFTIASAMVLSIQQLSEVNDNIERYNMLTKIGIDKSMIKKSLLIQIGIYFFIPLKVAIIHSIVGLKISSTIIKVFGQVNFLQNIIVSISILLLIYIGYFLATYISVKNNIIEKIK